MTCIAGMVSYKRVILGGDASASDEYTISISKDPKVFVKDNFIYGFADSFKIGQLVRYNFERDRVKLIDDKYLYTNFFPSLEKFIKRRIRKGDDNFDFLIGVTGRLFHFQSDYSVIETTCGYDAIGLGSEVALGALYAMQFDDSITSQEKINRALEASEYHNSSIRRPFTILEL